MDEIRSGCKIIDVQGLTTRILTKYTSTDFPQLNLREGVNNNLFNSEIEQYEQTTYRDAVVHALISQRVFIEDGFRNLLYTIPKKTTFRYISDNKYLVEAYNTVINDMFKNVGNELQFRRITDGYTSKIDLIYDIFLNIEVAKYIFTHFFYVPVDPMVIPIVFLKQHPTLAPKYNEFLPTVLKKDAVEQLLKLNEPYLLRIIDAETQHQGNLWAIASMESREARNKRIDFFITYEIVVDYTSRHPESDVAKELLTVDLQQLLDRPDIEQVYMDYPQFIHVYNMFTSKEFIISAECSDKIDMLNQFKHTDMIPYNRETPPIVDDYDEKIFNVNEQKPHADIKFKFLYLQQRRMVTIDGINYSNIGNYAIAELYRKVLNFNRFAPNFFTDEFIPTFRTYKDDKDTTIKNGLATTAIKIINDNLKMFGPIQPTDCFIFKSPNKFLGSMTTTSRYDENFIGNYLSFLAKLTLLPMIRRPYIEKWITRVKSLNSLESVPKLANLVIPDKKGLSEIVAKVLILAFIYNLGDDPANFEEKGDRFFL